MPREAKTPQVEWHQRGQVAPDDLPELLLRHRWEIGARLRAIRTQQGLSQVVLADRAGLDHRTVSRIETGRHPTDIDVLYRLALALGVPSWRFFRDAD